ncbi:DUF1501 domain-containing protein [Tundrisphaera lichenicola]|uniref:DUF1501 domain-containing protein n=1 Tax=Tundrisphaera lichenicola TaxID=2029860 RepID=UPI003EBAFD87
MRTTGSRAIGAHDGATRRDLLKLGGLGALGLGLTGGPAGAARADGHRSVILLMMVGGPSQLETFDPKPEAPSEVRGPFRAIETSLPGVRVVEHLPGIARRMDRLTLVRSMNHDAAPIHETGLQLLGTGQLCRAGAEHPHLGSIAARQLGASGGLPPFVVLPGPIGNTGVSVSHGQSAGLLGPSFEPFVLGDDPSSAGFDAAAAHDRARRFLDGAEGLVSAGQPSRSSRRAFDLDDEREGLREAYDRSAVGQGCLMARRLVESGVRVVVVNMFETVFGRSSWDAHGRGPFATLDDYARELLPAFDRAFSTLVDDLESRGLLDSTLVVASGEFGRTPRINMSGGRDHWTGAWSALLAGGGTAGGRVIGATDRTASEPVDRPVALAELFGTMAHSLGLESTDDGLASPIFEAFG